ncbi:putative UDP-glucuronate 4-epimerase [Helianthus debilis subsp. tardiflorus]
MIVKISLNPFESRINSYGSRTVTLDYTYIDDIVKGWLGALDTAEKNTGSGRKKRGPAQLRVFNLGNMPPVQVSDLVGILERLLKVKARRVVMKLPRNGGCFVYAHEY